MSMVTIFGVNVTAPAYGAPGLGGFQDQGVPVLKFSNQERNVEVTIHVDHGPRDTSARELRKLAKAFLEAADRVDDLAREAEEARALRKAEEDEEEDL